MPHPNLSPSHPLYDFTVIGSGLVGLAAALGLAQQGWRVALVGPDEAVRNNPHPDDWDSRVYAFSPATQALLTRLHVWQQLPLPDRASGKSGRIQPVSAMQVFGQSAETLLAQPALAHDHIEFTAYQACVPELAWIAESRVVQQALATGCRYHPQITWRNTQADSWSRQADGVQLGLADGQHITSKLVLGADGANSWVRAQAGVSVNQHDYQQTGIVANFSCTLPHGGTAWQWFRPDGILALLPLPGQRVSMVWSANPAQAAHLQSLHPSELANAVTQASGGVMGELTTLTAATAFPLKLRVANHLIAERVALLGDAAHVLHPLAGQGMNLGMGDVTAWLDVLAQREPFRTLDDPRLLARYARRRAWPIMAMRGVTHGLQQLFALEVPSVQWLRSQGMRWLNHAPLQTLVAPIKRKLIRYALYS